VASSTARPVVEETAQTTSLPSQPLLERVRKEPKPETETAPRPSPPPSQPLLERMRKESKEILREVDSARATSATAKLHLVATTTRARSSPEPTAAEEKDDGETQKDDWAGTASTTSHPVKKEKAGKETQKDDSAGTASTTSHPVKEKEKAGKETQKDDSAGTASTTSHPVKEKEKAGKETQKDDSAGTASTTSHPLKQKEKKEKSSTTPTTTATTTTRTTTTIPYDCSLHASSWQTRWSDHKKVWCCDSRGVGCTTAAASTATTTEDPFADPLLTFLAPVQYVASTTLTRTTTTATTTGPYNCSMGRETWRFTWSLDKQDWCCQNARLGCSFTDTTTLDTSGRAPTTRDPMSLQVKHRFSPSDCNATHADRWSLEQAKWCCAHTGRGCAATASQAGVADGIISDASLAGGDGSDGIASESEASSGDMFSSLIGRVRSLLMGQPKATSKSIFPSGGTLHSFNCSEGFDHWQWTWSPEKRDFCCQEVGHGCGSLSEKLVIYNCHADYLDWERAWSRAKQTWCCKAERRGCSRDADPSTKFLPIDDLPGDYDCNADLGMMQAAWSARKRQWCCAKKGLGCPGSMEAGADALGSGADAAVPFDCKAGASNWRLGWSEEKKGWCCRHAQLGCSTSAGAASGADLSRKFEDGDDALLRPMEGLTPVRKAFAAASLAVSCAGLVSLAAAGLCRRGQRASAPRHGDYHAVPTDYHAYADSLLAGLE